jgi:23S rRNA G2445 N2-methylase RlmL
MSQFQLHAVPVEVFVTEGLEFISKQEIEKRIKYRSDMRIARPGVIRFMYSGTGVDLLSLRTVFSVYIGKVFPGQRPNALLGNQVFEKLVNFVETVTIFPEFGSCSTFSLKAAGADTPVMKRIAYDVAEALNLRLMQDEGDLEMRLQRDDQRTGWEVLVRLTSRPLSARSWRVADYKGALNAAAANAMVQLSLPNESDRVLNICSGSGTLLIERALAGRFASLTGIDIQNDINALARRNIEAAQLTEVIEIVTGDAAYTNLADESIDVVLGDLPFGIHVGEKADNFDLYYQLLIEAYRIGTKQCRYVLITNDRENMDAAIDSAVLFDIVHKYRINLRSVRPTIYVLKKK